MSRARNDFGGGKVILVRNRLEEGCVEEWQKFHEVGDIVQGVKSNVAFGYAVLTHTRGRHKVRFPIFYLKHKEVTLSYTRVR
jgi:hypothetical protein